MEEFQFSFESSAQIHASQRSLFSLQVGMVGMIDSLTNRTGALRYQGQIDQVSLEPANRIE